LECQLYFLAFTQLRFPNRTPTTTETHVVSAPVGGNAKIVQFDYTIKPAG